MHLELHICPGKAKSTIIIFFCINAPAAFVSRAWIIKPNLLFYSHPKTQQCTRNWCPAFHLKTRVSHPHQHLMLRPNACPGANWCRNCTAAKAWTPIQTITAAPTMHQMQVNTSFHACVFKLVLTQVLESNARLHPSPAGSISLSESDLFFDPTEEALCKEVVQLIALNLADAKDGVLHCSKLHVPEKLLEHIGQELVHLSVSEPCGLRGALVDLCVEQDGGYEAVAEISVDPDLVPTFQLTLVLRLDSQGFWPKIQGLFASSPVLRSALKLSTGFRVIKRKLYCSEELLIEECWAWLYMSWTFTRF